MCCRLKPVKFLCRFPQEKLYEGNLQHVRVWVRLRAQGKSSLSLELKSSAPKEKSKILVNISRPDREYSHEVYEGEIRRAFSFVPIDDFFQIFKNIFRPSVFLMRLV